MPPSYSNESSEIPDRQPGEGLQTKISDYAYSLPPERIALHPLPNREHSKLLINEGGRILDSRFDALDNWLKEGDLLVMNQSRVIHARLHFQTAQGARIEIFCVSREKDADAGSDLGTSETWLCLVGKAAKWKQAEELILQHDDIWLKVSNLGRETDLFRIAFTWSRPEYTFGQILEIFGKLPLPPYLNRQVEQSDAERYQTVYASEAGSVAAPTAGLHFTPELLSRLQQKGIQIAYVTLHVGTGTFKPVKSATLEGHQMHREEFFVPLETLERISACRGRVIAVGTTVLRTLESIFLAGCMSPGKEVPSVSQWDGLKWQEGMRLPGQYQPSEVREQFRNLAALRAQSGGGIYHGYTSLLICPPYRIQSVQALLTNFHQPESTLLLLVAAFVGSSWRELYDHALKNDYRFLSYGDASLLLPG